MNSRRSFLMKIGAGMIASLVVRPSLDDVKLLMWSNGDGIWYSGNAGGGKSLEFIGNHGFVVESEIVKIELERIMPKVKKLFQIDDQFYKVIKSKVYAAPNDYHKGWS